MRIRTSTELGARLREQRRALGLSQAALAERLGTSRQWIVDLEHGKPRLELGLVLRAVAALDLDVRIDEPRSASRSDLRLPSIDVDAIVERARRRR